MSTESSIKKKTSKTNRKKLPVCKYRECGSPILTMIPRSYCQQCELASIYFEKYWKALLAGELPRPDKTIIHNFLRDKVLKVANEGQWGRINNHLKMNGMFQKILEHNNKEDEECKS